MSVSEKQLKANRENARKSTGPKTAEGKAKSSKNALKFGITTDDIIVKSRYYAESAEDYRELLQSLKNELRPKSAMQDHLVKMIADCFWRYRRIIAAETARIEKQINNSGDSWENGNCEPPEEEDQAFRNLIDTKKIPANHTGYDFHRYERRVLLQLNRAYNMLMRLQEIDQERFKNRVARENRQSLKKSLCKTNPFLVPRLTDDDTVGIDNNGQHARRAEVEEALRRDSCR